MKIERFTLRFYRREQDWRTDELRERWDKAVAVQFERNREWCWRVATAPRPPDNVLLFGGTTK